MADTKITALTAIGANPIIPSTFPIPMVDLTDTSMAASGTTKKVTVNQILGAGGTATLASATITGDLTVDTSTLKVDSANNFVGVGTTTGVNLAAGRGNLTIGGSSSAILNLSIGATDTGYVIHDGTSIYLVNRIAAGSLIFSTNSTERLRIDSSGNVGIGVTPSAWQSNFKGLELGRVGNGLATYTAAGGAADLYISSNAYYNGGFKYANTGQTAGVYSVTGNVHSWYTAASGTAGTSITDFATAKMTLDASGNLLVGTTSGLYRGQFVVTSGADRNIFAAQVTGASNGLQVQWDHATTTIRVILANIPTSSAGLASGTLWNDAGTIKIV